MNAHWKASINYNNNLEKKTQQYQFNFITALESIRLLYFILIVETHHFRHLIVCAFQMMINSVNSTTFISLYRMFLHAIMQMAKQKKLIWNDEDSFVYDDSFCAH